MHPVRPSRHAKLLLVWIPWHVAAIAALSLGAGFTAVRPRNTTEAGARARRAPLAGVLRESALLCALYSLWRLGERVHGLATTHGVDRAIALWNIERFVHLPDERVLVDAALRRPIIAQAANGYYAIAHAPAMIMLLIWTMWRHRGAYQTVRNAVTVATGTSLLLHLIAVAPPRLVPSLGFVDVAQRFHQSVYGPVGSGISDQMGALPSVHVAWAALVAWGTWCQGRGRWRIVGPAHLILTMVAIVVTANHWWLDGVVAAVIVWAALDLDRRWRTMVTMRSARHALSDPVEAAGSEKATASR